jgi:hypothetical protein
MGKIMRQFRQARASGKKNRLRLLGGGLALMWLLAAIAYFLLQAYLGTTAAASRVSLLLSEFLRQPVAVAGLGLTGGALKLSGVRMANPGGFQHGELATVQSLVIAPDWLGLLAGRHSLGSLELHGFRVRLTRDSGGEWNFQPLARRFSGREKGPPTEFTIGRLVVDNSSLSVNDFTLDRLAVAVRNFSTRGTGNSGLLISFTDRKGNPCRLQGAVRPGPEPDLDVSLSAPVFSLAEMADLAGHNPALNLRPATASLMLTAGLHRGELAAELKMGVTGGDVLVKGVKIPLQGELSCRAFYSVRDDSGRVENGRLLLNGLLSLSGSAKVRHAKAERVFTAEIAGDDVDLGRAWGLLPAELRRGLIPSGALRLQRLQLAGDRTHGLTGGVAELHLKQGGLAQGGTAFFKGLTADLTLKTAGRGWGLDGRLTLAKSDPVMMLQSLDARVSGQLSSRLHPLGLTVPYQAVVMAAPLHGRLSFNPAEALPYAAELDLPAASLTLLNTHLASRNLRFSAGTAALTLRVTGSSPQSVQGSLTADVRDLRGSLGERKFALMHGETRAGFSRGRQGLVASGTGKLAGGIVNDQSVAADFGYRLANGRLTLGRGTCLLGGIKVGFAEVSGDIPRPQVSAAGQKMPLNIMVRDLGLERGNVSLAGINGHLAGNYLTGQGVRRLEGGGKVTVASLAYGGESLGNLAATLAFGKSGAALKLTGAVLDGTVTGTGSLDPLAAGSAVAFSLRAGKISAPRLLRLAGRSAPLALTTGSLTADLTGDYHNNSGLRCRLAAVGSDLTLAREGRTMVAGAAASLDGELAADSFLVTAGEVATGKDVALQFKGRLDRLYSAAREGIFSFSMAPAPVNTLLGTFSNMLPRSFQEGNASGRLALNGSARISGGKVFLDGEGVLQDGLLELPGQKLILADINGSLPFSLDLAGTASAPPRETVKFDRENYPLLMRELRGRDVAADHRLTIGRTRFGTQELGRATIAARAGKGLTEMVSFDTGLYGGNVRGKGFFRYRQGAEYGADFLVDNVSLREVCNSIPSIKGYINGRVNGIMSLFKESGSAKGAAGFVQLWVHKGADEKMLVSKEFLQKLAGKKLQGFIFNFDRPYDRGEIIAYLEDGFLTFETLDISHTNFIGVKDLNVSVVSANNRISLENLLTSIKDAAARGKGAKGTEPAAAQPPQTEFKWLE